MKGGRRKKLIGYVDGSILPNVTINSSQPLSKEMDKSKKFIARRPVSKVNRIER